MRIIHHRRNSVAELAQTPPEFGVEIDLRNHGDEILVTHDPFQTDAVRFDDWLKGYHHSFLIANVKEEGLEPRLLELFNRHGITDYFILDESFPFIRKYALRGLPHFALRVSEYESAETPIRLATELARVGQAVTWIWVDSFTGRLIAPEVARRLRDAGFKLCFVSPELHHVDDPANWDGHIRHFLDQLRQTGAEECWPDMVCTKLPDLWRTAR